MKDPYGLSKASVPVTYAQILLDILVERGFSAEQVLSKSRLSAQLFSGTEARITPRQGTRLVMSALSLTGDDGLGYEYGLRLRPTAHGTLGFALMSCSTLGQAIQLGAAYFSMRLRDYRICLRTEGDIAELEIAATHPIFGAIPEQTPMLHRFFYECVMVGIAHLGRFLTGRDLSGVEIWVDWPEPIYHGRYRDRLPLIRFNQPANQFRGPAAILDLPLGMADPVAYEQALVQCEVERIRFAESVEDIAARVSAELILVPGKGYPSLEMVAERLHLSGRTLMRRLQQLNLSYLALLDQTVRQEAEKLLASDEMDIQDIANLLGYINPANFTRAFKKWTGETPSQFRTKVRSSPAAT
jgi:AraC-like DNA-binding protein